MGKKLNLGCGPNTKEGFLNVDAVWFPGVDFVWDCSKGLPPVIKGFTDVERVESYHFLEHLSRDEAEYLLLEMFHVMEEGGVGVFELPDLEAMCKNYTLDPEYCTRGLYGDQSNEFDFHKYNYSQGSIKELLEGAGFTDVEFFPPRDYHAKESLEKGFQALMRVEFIKPYAQEETE